MANEMPDPESHAGLSRTVLQYADRFQRLAARIRSPDFTESDWAPIEALVDTAQFVRLGIFLTDRAEPMGWQEYRTCVTQYAGYTTWEGTLRRITEVAGLVILELEERNTREGVTDVSNTVTIYEFTEDGKLRRLDVYVMPLGKTAG